MLDYRDISLMESVPLMWGPVTASPVGIERGGPPPLIIDIQYITARIQRFARAGPPNTPYDCAEARRTQVADATFRDLTKILRVPSD